MNLEMYYPASASPPHFLSSICALIKALTNQPAFSPTAPTLRPHPILYPDLRLWNWLERNKGSLWGNWVHWSRPMCHQCLIYSGGAVAEGNKNLHLFRWVDAKEKWCRRTTGCCGDFAHLNLKITSPSENSFKSMQWSFCKEITLQKQVDLVFDVNDPCFFFPILGNDTGLRGNLSGTCVWERPGLRGFVSGSESGGSAGHGLWPTRSQGRSGCSRLLQETEEGETAHAGACRALPHLIVITWRYW